MGLAHWCAPDARFAERDGDRTYRCASTIGDRRPSAAIELSLYLPRRAWHFTFTRKRTAPVEFRGNIQTDDDRDQIAAPTVS
jgi:hypothetical protein